jgi:mannose-6-phosphate isomerase-like protein (cupin superfamily)
MRHLVKESTEPYAVGVVDVFPWDKFSLGLRLPFGAQWYTLPPNATSNQDCHPEVEFSIVVHGTASVEASGQITDVAAGEIFLLDSEEAHVIHNRSGNASLTVFTTFWMPLEDGPDSGTAGGEEAEAAMAGETRT